MQAYEITVDGCASGLGLGLDSVNRVTILRPGGPADACGLIAVGDRIVSVDGEPLGGLQLQQVLRPADRHVFGIEAGDGAAAAAASREDSRIPVGTAVAASANPQDPAIGTSLGEPPEPLPGPPPEPLPPPLPPSRAALFASLMQKVRAVASASCMCMYGRRVTHVRMHIPQAIDHRLAVLQSYADDPAKDPEMHMASSPLHQLYCPRPNLATTATTSSTTAFTASTTAPTHPYPPHTHSTPSSYAM